MPDPKHILREAARWNTPISDEEQPWVDYAAEHDLFVSLGTHYPPEDDPDAYEPFDTVAIGKERRMDNGKIAAYWIDVTQSPTHEQNMDHLAKLLQAGLERYIEEELKRENE